MTFNESPNLSRTLQRLHWAQDVVVVDSFSEDNTLAIAQTFPQVRTFQRAFDSHERQWNFALRETEVHTEWVLALDADYVLSAAIVDEIQNLRPSLDVSGSRARFVYCINGHPLRGSAYPPVTVLYRRSNALYRQDGHTQRLVVEGNIEDLHSPIFHDDRKSLSHWIRSQDRYSQQEATKLVESAPNTLGYADRLRKTGLIAPILVFFYCMLIKGAILDGWPGMYYSFQRMLAESLLALRLIEHRLTQKP